LPVLAFIGATLPGFVSEEDGSPAFYSTAAGIIPTLLLTLAVTSRFFHVATMPAAVVRPGLDLEELKRTAPERYKEVLELATAKRRTESFYAFWVFALLALGEACAVGAVATDQQAWGLFGVICGALAAGFTAIGFIAFVGPSLEDAEPVDEA
jgi:hypothetical protein